MDLVLEATLEEILRFGVFSIFITVPLAWCVSRARTSQVRALAVLVMVLGGTIALYIAMYAAGASSWGARYRLLTGIMLLTPWTALVFARDRLDNGGLRKATVQLWAAMNVTLVVICSTLAWLSPNFRR